MSAFKEEKEKYDQLLNDPELDQITGGSGDPGDSGINYRVDEDSHRERPKKNGPGIGSKLTASLGSAAKSLGNVAKQAASAVGRGGKAVVKSLETRIVEGSEKRSALVGLREDFSVRGRTKRYWLDASHYIVFDPDNAAERDMAKQAIDDYKMFGQAEGERGDRNEVILAGDEELATKKLQRDPVISPEFSKKMQKGGRYLADAPLFGDNQPRRRTKRVDPEDDPLDSGEEDVTFDEGDEPSGPRRFSAPSVKSAMGLDVRTPRVRTPEAGKIPEIKIFSDKELFPAMVKKRQSRQEDYGGETSGPQRVAHVVNPLAAIPRISIGSGQPQTARPAGRVEYRPPNIEEISPRIILPGPSGSRQQGPVVYRSPDIESIMPKVDFGWNPSRRKQQEPEPEPVKQVKAKKPAKKSAEKVPKSGKKPKPSKARKK